MRDTRADRVCTSRAEGSIIEKADVSAEALAEKVLSAEGLAKADGRIAGSPRMGRSLGRPGEPSRGTAGQEQTLPW